MKTMRSFLMPLFSVNIALAAALVVFLFATGRLDGAKSRAIVDLVRHQGTPPQFRQRLDEILQSTAGTSTSASQAAGAPAAPGEQSPENLAASAEDRIAFAHQAMEQERLALESAAQDLRHRQELLEKLQAQVSAGLKKIEDAKKESGPRAASSQEKVQQDNFQKSLALFDELKSKQVKDIFIENKDPDLAAAYLAAMDPSQAGKIIGEFKTPDEQTFLAVVLERIRNHGMNSASTQPGNQTAAAPPIAPPPPAP